MIRRLLPLLGMFALTASVLGACGSDDQGDGGAGDRVAITTALERFSAGSGPGGCQELMTARFVTALYETSARCRKENAGEEPVLQGVQVSDVRAEGGRGSAILSGSYERYQVDGRVEVRRVGSTWRMDAFGADFVRSVFLQFFPQGLAQSLVEGDGDTSLARTAGVQIADCVETRLRELDDEQVVRMGNALFGNREDAPEIKKLRSDTVSCTADAPAMRKLARQTFESGIRRTAPSTAISDCVLERTRDSVKDETLLRLGSERLKGQDGRNARRVAAATQEAARACGGPAG